MSIGIAQGFRRELPHHCSPKPKRWGEDESLTEGEQCAKRVTLHFPDGHRECVLFLALRDKDVNQELLWDYGRAIQLVC